MNLPQPPEGILDPKVPWSRINPNSRLWLILKARLTGKPQGDGYNYSSYVNLSNEEADRLIANIKKDPRGYPSLDQESGTPIQWMERQRLYQEWLVEAYLNNPFEESVSEKIVEQTSEVLVEAQEEIQEAETKAEVSDILEDKIDILEDIQEKIAPPPTENKIPDPWEGSETVPKPKKKKRERRRLNRPKNTVTGRRKRKPSTPPGGGNEPPKPPRRKKSFATRLGGSVRKTGKSLGSSLLDKLEGAQPLGENMGPSVLGAGIWIGKKINAAFQDAKKERARAIEAEKSGAEVPPEVKEKGYFIRKSLAHQFGGRVLDQTVGAFFENIPSKQSSKKAGFGDKFDYGDGDPNKKKKQSEVKDLATGFRKVTSSLRGINKSINDQIGLMTKLVGETSRVADALEGIQNAIAKSIDVEIQGVSDEAETQQAAQGDISIPDIDLSGLLGKEGGGLDWFDLIMAADDVRDIKNKMKGGGQRTTTRRGGAPKVTGDVKPRRRFKFPSLPGRRMKFSEGAASVKQSVPALIGEAGPEVLIRGAQKTSPKKFAEGGVMQGAGSNILATGLGVDKGLFKKVQPFANTFTAAFQVIGAHISNALSALVNAAGPFSGAIAKMFSPLMGGLATLFGLNQGAFAAEINSAAMTEKQGAKELSRFFSKFFSLFGFTIDDEGRDDDTDVDMSGVSPGAKGLLDFIARYESGGDYNKIFGGKSIPGLTDKTIREVVQIQKAHLAEGYESAAIGRYQMMLPDVYAKKAGLSLDDKFSEANQDRMAMEYLKEDGWEDYISGKLDAETFADRVAGTWAALPTRSGRSAHAGVGSNKHLVEREKYMAQIRAAKEMSRGGVVSVASNFANQVQGVFELSGPDTGYIVPQEYTRGEPIIGHGLEYLINMGNKFVVLPVINKEYNVYKDPAKAYNRYEKIGLKGGIEVAGLMNFIDGLIAPPKTGKMPVYGEGFKPRRVYRAEDESGAEVLRLLGGTPVKGAMLTPQQSMPEGQVTPVAIPKDTVTGTTGEVVAMIQPMIQYVPMPVPGPERVEYVEANPFVAARTSIEMLQLQGLT